MYTSVHRLVILTYLNAAVIWKETMNFEGQKLDYIKRMYALDLNIIALFPLMLGIKVTTVFKRKYTR